jgi:hypothetical protein
MQLFTIVLFYAMCAVAADYLELRAFASKTCEGDTLLYMARDMGDVVCVNSTYWKHKDPSDTDEGFICAAPSSFSPYGSSSSFLCRKGAYNYTKHLTGAVLSYLPSRESCTQKPSMIQQFSSPGACILAGPTGSVQVACDTEGVTFSFFDDAQCSGAPSRFERNSYGCNLTYSMAAEIAECSGF